MAEASGRWAVGEHSTLSVYVSDAQDLSLFIEYQGAEAELFSVLVNDVTVGQVGPTSDWTTQTLELEAGVLHPGVNLIEFAFQLPRDRPLQLRLGNPETIVREMIGDLTPSIAHLRDLLPEIREVFPGASLHGDGVLNLPGVDVVNLIDSDAGDGIGGGWEWRSLAAGSFSAQFRTIALRKRAQPSAEDTQSAGLALDRGALSVSRSGRLFIPLESETPRESLTFAASTRAGVGRTADLRLSVASDDDPRSLGGETLDGLWGRAGYAETLGLGDLSGPACLVVEIDVDLGGGPVAIETVELAPTRPESRLPPHPSPTPPDIVLIVLDAARPDHFGCYGYGRNTTPNIDRLAEEGFVFTNAFATASYTACSVPTMVSGLSFLDHGVTNRRRVLDENVTTLAESLQQQGYTTSCYSANPNHSIRRGLGQGCDTFEELWRGRSGGVGKDPYLMSALAAEKLADASDDPQFLMLHYIPPHEPYLPRSEFDLFGDESYTGEVDGTVATIRRIKGGSLAPNADDLRELVSLYDGNLRTADDAVGRVIDILRKRDRWNRTAVLVTSDHGEAFLEHGYIGHNTTVYDEMLRVPFILRLPDGAATHLIDTEQLVSLEDIVPTLLGQAGLSAASSVSGDDLVSPTAFSPRRGIVARAAHAPRVLAYRTPAWALVDALDTLELYDTSTDPAQHHNLYLEDFERTLCLSSLLELERSRPAIDEDTGSDALDQEDLDALRSLGYVR